MRRSVFDQIQARRYQTRKKFHGSPGDPNYPHGGGEGAPPGERGSSITRERDVANSRVSKLLKDYNLNELKTKAEIYSPSEMRGFLRRGPASGGLGVDLLPSEAEEVRRAIEGWDAETGKMYP